MFRPLLLASLLWQSLLVHSLYTIYHDDPIIQYTDRNATWTTFSPGAVCPAMNFRNLDSFPGGGQRFLIPFKGTRITIYGFVDALDPPVTLITSMDGQLPTNTTIQPSLNLLRDTVDCNATYFISEKVFFDVDHVLNVTIGTNGNPEPGRGFNFERVEIEEDTTFRLTPLPTSTTVPFVIPQPTGSVVASTDNQDESRPMMSTAALAGTVIGGVIFIAALIALAVYLTRRRNQRKYVDSEAGERYDGSMFTRDSVYPPSEYAIASPFYGGTPGHQPRGRVVHRSMIRSIMSGTTLRPLSNMAVVPEARKVNLTLATVAEEDSNADDSEKNKGYGEDLTSPKLTEDQVALIEKLASMDVPATTINRMIDTMVAGKEAGVPRPASPKVPPAPPYDNATHVAKDSLGNANQSADAPIAVREGAVADLAAALRIEQTNAPVSRHESPSEPAEERTDRTRIEEGPPTLTLSFPRSL